MTTENDPVLIVTGPPGVGKTTVSRTLAERRPRAVHMEADAFFAFIRSGLIEPWRRQSHDQNRQVMDIAATAAIGYADAGYSTIVDGIFIPGWFFEPLRDALRGAGHEVALVVLRSPLEVCEQRLRARDRAISDAKVIDQLWQSFADLGDLERHVVNIDDRPAAKVAEELEASLASGRLSL